MATIFGIGPPTLVILIVAIVAAVPVVLYYDKTYRWFVYAYGFLFVAAFATNFENLFLPDVLNLVEHTVGNLGAAIAFAVAAYKYRTEHITGRADETLAEEA